MIIVLLLLFPNYYLEYLKWDKILLATNQQVKQSVKIQSFLAGIITGMLTPNMQGNFIGRIYYFQRKYRLPIILLTLTSNLGQFCITIVLGIIALFILNGQTLPYLSLLLLFLFISLLFYFTFEKIPFLKQRFKWYEHTQHILKSNQILRFQILWFSFLRNLIFSIQLLLALHAFGAEINLKTYWLIWNSICGQLYLHL